MKKIFTLFLTFALPHFLFSQNSFLKVVGDQSTREETDRIMALDDGSAVVGGVDFTTPFQYGDFFLAKTNEEGALLWYKILDGPEPVSGMNSLLSTVDGGLLVGGISDVDGLEDNITLVKTSGEGTVEWTKYYGVGRLGNVVVNPSGGYAMLVYTNFLEPTVVGLDDAGNSIWETSIGSGSGDVVSLTTTNDGGFSACHVDAGDGTIVSKLNNGGDILWQTIVTDDVGDFFRAEGHIELANGNFLVAGQNSFLTSYNVWLDADGNIVNQIESFSSGVRPGGLAELSNGDLIHVTTFFVIQYDSEGQYLSEMARPMESGAIRGAAFYPESERIFATSAHDNADSGRDLVAFVWDAPQALEIGWTTIIGDGKPSSDERSWMCREAADGDFVLIGERAYPGSNGDFYLLKVNGIGDVVWEARYGTAADENVYAVTALSDGGFLLTGNRITENDEEYLVLLKVDNLGFEVWEKTYDYSEPGLFTNHLAEELPSGELAIIFRTSSSGAFYMRTSAEGDSILTTPIGPTTSYRQMRNAADGNLLLTGFGFNNSFGELQKIDLDGNPIFIRQVQEGNASLGLGYGVEETDDGGILMLSDVRFTFDSVALIKLDAMGEEEWLRFYNPSSSPFPSYFRPQLAKTTDGNFVMSITSFREEDTPDETQIFLIKVDAEGDIIWENTAGDFTFSEIIFSSDATSDGGLLMSGYAHKDGNTENDLLLIKTLADGSLTTTLEVKRLGEMAISPNPSSGPLSLLFESEYTGDIDISIFDKKGRLVRSFPEEKYDASIQLSYDLSTLVDGVYFVRLSANGQSISSTWVKH